MWGEVQSGQPAECEGAPMCSIRTENFGLLPNMVRTRKTFAVATTFHHSREAQKTLEILAGERLWLLTICRWQMVKILRTTRSTAQVILAYSLTLNPQLNFAISTAYIYETLLTLHTRGQSMSVHMCGVRVQL